MIRFLIVFAALALLIPTVVSGGGGMIAVFTDASAGDCDFVDGGGVFWVYYFHLYHTGVTQSRFKLNYPPAWQWLGDIFEFPLVIGTTPGGVSIAYERCVIQQIYLGRSVFLGAGVPPCTPIGIGPHPDAPSGRVEAVDCHGPFANIIFPDGGQGFVNGDGSCPCIVPLPVEETTWGQIKGMYE